MGVIIAAILTIVFLVFGCSQQNLQPCYHCTFFVQGSYQRPPMDTCGDVTKFKFQDPYGGDLQFYCQPK